MKAKVRPAKISACFVVLMFWERISVRKAPGFGGPLIDRGHKTVGAFSKIGPQGRAAGSGLRFVLCLVKYKT